MQQYEIVQQNRSDLNPVAQTTFINQMANSQNNSTIFNNYSKLTNIDPDQNVVINHDSSGKIYVMGYGNCDHEVYNVVKPLVYYNGDCETPFCPNFVPCQNLNNYIYLLKLSPNLDLIWKIFIGGVNTNISATFTVCDDKIYITGSFDETLEFYNPVGKKKVRICNNCSDFNIFVAVIKTTGKILWVNYITSKYFNTVTSIISKQNYVYVTGRFSKSIKLYNFDNQLQTTVDTNFTNNAFLIKYNPNGSYGWVDYLYSGIALSQYVIDISDITINDNIYISGTVQNTLVNVNRIFNNILQQDEKIYYFTKSDNQLSAFLMSLNLDGDVIENTIIDNVADSNISIAVLSNVYMLYNTTESAFIKKFNLLLETELWQIEIRNAYAKSNSNIAVDELENIYTTTIVENSNAEIYNSQGRKIFTVLSRNTVSNFITKINKFGEFLYVTRQSGINNSNVAINLNSVNSIIKIMLVGTFQNQDVNLYDSNGVAIAKITTTQLANTFIATYYDYAQTLFLPYINFPGFEKKIVLEQSNMTNTVIFPKYDCKIYFDDKQVSAIVLSRFSIIYMILRQINIPIFDKDYISDGVTLSETETNFPAVQNPSRAVVQQDQTPSTVLPAAQNPSRIIRNAQNLSRLFRNIPNPTLPPPKLCGWYITYIKNCELIY